MQRIIILILGFLLHPSFAGTMPKFTIEPTGVPIITVPNLGFADVTYRVTNNTKITRTLTFKPIAGVIQRIAPGLCASPFTLNPDDSCLLNLIARDTESGASISRGGPVVCKTNSADDDSPSPFLCSQPANNQQLVIQGSALIPGELLCWGNNRSQQAGIELTGQTRTIDYPTKVEDLNQDIIMTSVGREHSCSLDIKGGVKCWGANSSGQLGTGESTDTIRYNPVFVQGLQTGVTQISAGGAHNCALLASGNVMCWGLNANGELGNGNTQNALTPTPVEGLAGPVIKISANNTGTCALLSSGGVQCWGNNNVGQLGVPLSTTQSLHPLFVTNLSKGVVDLANGTDFSCVLMSSGRVYCWGQNNAGQLGKQPTGPNDSSYIPLEVTGFKNTPVFVRLSRQSGCAILSDKSAQCWGDNQYGQLGAGINDPSPNPTPQDVLIPTTNIADLRCGEWACYALLEDKTAMGWGNGSFSMLANNNVVSEFNPTPIPLNADSDDNPLTNILKLTNRGQKFTFCAIVSATM